MLSLRALFRCLILTFCVVVLLLGWIVFQNTQTQDDATRGNLLAFLFTRQVAETPVPALLPAPEPEPAPPPAVEEPKPENDIWQPVPHGKQPGKGSLDAPTLTKRNDGSVEIRIPYKGKLGQYGSFKPDGFAYGRTVDLYGSWSRGSNIRHPLSSGNITLIQTGTHPQMFRISSVGKNAPITEEVTASADTLRIVFRNASAKEK